MMIIHLSPTLFSLNSWFYTIATLISSEKYYHKDATQKGRGVFFISVFRMRWLLFEDFFAFLFDEKSFDISLNKLSFVLTKQWNLDPLFGMHQENYAVFMRWVWKYLKCKWNANKKEENTWLLRRKCLSVISLLLFFLFSSYPLEKSAELRIFYYKRNTRSSVLLSFRSL